MNKSKFFALSISAVLCMSMCYACKKDDNNTNNTTTLPKIIASNLTLFEGDDVSSTFRVKLSLNQATDKEVSVNYQTQALSAKENEDFTPNAGQIIFPKGSTSAEIAIIVVADTLKEGDEDFKVVFSNPTNATLSQTEIICTIRNDDTYSPSSNDGYSTPDSYAGYKLAWADEFNGSSIDTQNWGYDIGGSGWGNNESQFYTNRSKNAFIENGKLVIQALKEKYDDKDYTSARLLTKGKREFMFGRIDIRAKLPKGQGIWPALWMLGSNIGQVGWPACGEIDIMELLGHEPSKSYSTIHWGAQGAGASQTAQGVFNLSNGKTFADEFHVFSFIWEKDVINILVDDKPCFSTTAAKLGASNYLYNAPFFFIFNIAVGGNWPGYPNATTVFPQRMEVDYIRVFQK